MKKNETPRSTYSDGVSKRSDDRSSRRSRSVLKTEASKKEEEDGEDKSKKESLGEKEEKQDGDKSEENPYAENKT